jgi:hypothetical protein
MKTYLATLAATAALALPIALSSSCARHTAYEPGPAAIPRVNPKVAQSYMRQAGQPVTGIQLGAGDRFGESIHVAYVNARNRHETALAHAGDSPERNYAQITLNPKKEEPLSAEDKAAIEAAEAWMPSEVSHGVLGDTPELENLIDDVHLVSNTTAITPTVEPIVWENANEVSYVLSTGILSDHQRIMDTYSQDDRQGSVEKKPVNTNTEQSGPWTHHGLNELHHKGDTK